MTDAIRIRVQDHVFFLTDRDVSTPFETMDHSTGLAGVMESAALVAAGIDRGYVTVSTEPADHRPPLDTAEQWAALASWEDVAEFSLHVPHGALTVAPLEYTPAELPVLPTLSRHGGGYYRVRLQASGRDRHFDRVVEESGERFHIIAWPGPPAGPLVIKAGSRCGYGLRLAQLQAPPPTDPLAPTPEQQAEAEHEALLRQNLLAGAPDQAESQ
ncbi:hypothetical protein EV385_5798 [Krasilnikovia cinnamomea]|uniref:Uncharacterized protein n=1 Tax=Krasilnikovia cinnamomea TaxID=349313 RepID=A0A4Q7ZSM8_9ACTN|nr:hypothetical protein [Krasilnikovia cinnamomea]RZU53864.1 hypothetical protein EV385_5798 [Krasilnikovia cinnamomea]